MPFPLPLLPPLCISSEVQRYLLISLSGFLRLLVHETTIKASLAVKVQSKKSNTGSRVKGRIIHSAGAVDGEVVIDDEPAVVLHAEHDRDDTRHSRVVLEVERPVEALLAALHEPVPLAAKHLHFVPVHELEGDEAKWCGGVPFPVWPHFQETYDGSWCRERVGDATRKVDCAVNERFERRDMHVDPIADDLAKVNRGRVRHLGLREVFKGRRPPT